MYNLCNTAAREQAMCSVLYCNVCLESRFIGISFQCHNSPHLWHSFLSLLSNIYTPPLAIIICGTVFFPFEGFLIRCSLHIQNLHVIYFSTDAFPNLFPKNYFLINCRQPWTLLQAVVKFRQPFFTTDQVRCRFVLKLDVLDQQRVFPKDPRSWQIIKISRCFSLSLIFTFSLYFSLLL